MKKYLLTIAILINGLITFAQTPSSFQYQAVLPSLPRESFAWALSNKLPHDKIVRQQGK